MQTPYTSTTRMQSAVCIIPHRLTHDENVALQVHKDIDWPGVRREVRRGYTFI